MALHWPVMEKGDAPALPTLPVIRHNVLSRVTVSVPCTEWFTPIVQAAVADPARPNANAAARISSPSTPHSAATRSSG